MKTRDVIASFARATIPVSRPHLASAVSTPFHSLPGYTLVDGRLQSFPAERAPQVGDVIIEYRAVYPETVSTVAHLKHGRLVPYQTKAGDTLTMMAVGEHSAEDMFKEEEEWLWMRTWALRLLGCFFMFFAFGLILSPISSIAGLVPCIGPLLQVHFPIQCD